MQPLYTQIPANLAGIDDYEHIASGHLPEDILAYIQGGSGRELTLSRNRQALDAITIYNRPLQSMKDASTSLLLNGERFAHPFLLAPVGHQQLVHEQGELATLAGAEAIDTTMVVSTLSSVSLEDIAANAAHRHWFQLYCQPHPDATQALIDRACLAGYKAIVITVDTPVTAMRYRAQRANFVMPKHVTSPNLLNLPQLPITEVLPDASRVFNGVMAHSPTWEDITHIIKRSGLPIWIKGISHPDDACKALDIGAAGLVVSNHGGRALDAVPSAIETLPAIRRAIGSDVPLIIDGDIRSGIDAFKAIASGANAVFIGRPQLYALAVAGGLGVAHMIRTLREELEVTMALTGCSGIDHITQDCIFHSTR